MARKEDELESGGVGRPAWGCESGCLERYGRSGGDWSASQGALGGDLGASGHDSLDFDAISSDGRAHWFRSLGSFSCSEEAGVLEEFAVLLLRERKESRT